MIKIYQKEDEENAKANDVINDLVEKNIKSEVLWLELRL